MGRPAKITDAEILTVARQVFLDQGVSASTAEIAKRAGISEASIFKRFATKQDLFMAAIGIDKVPAWVRRLERESPCEDFKTELTELVREMLIFYQDVMPRILMLISPASLIKTRQFVPPPIRDARLLSLFLERAIAHQQIRPCDANTVASMIIGAINHYAISQSVLIKLSVKADALKPQPIDPDDFVRNLIESLWGGISPIE